jgi:LysM repeat protein
MFEETNPVSFQNPDKSSLFDVDNNNLLGKKSDLELNDDYSSSSFDLASTFEYGGNQYAWGEYSVQPRDTLGLLAEQTLDDGSAFGFIAAYNGIDNPNVIEVGQELMLPMEVYTLEGESKSQESAETYVVQAGDTLAQIAESIVGNAGAYEDIAAYNGISNSNFIFEGQELAIPVIDAKPIGQSYDDSEILLPSLKQNSGGSNLEIVQTAANNLSGQTFDFHFTPDEIGLPEEESNQIPGARKVTTALAEDLNNHFEENSKFYEDAKDRAADIFGRAGIAQELKYVVDKSFLQTKPKALLHYDLSFRDFTGFKGEDGKGSTSHAFLNRTGRTSLEYKTKGQFYPHKGDWKGLRLDYGKNVKANDAVNWHWNHDGGGHFGHADHAIPSSTAKTFGKTMKYAVKPLGRAVSVLAVTNDVLSIQSEVSESLETGEWDNTVKEVASVGTGHLGTIVGAKVGGVTGAALGVAGGPIGVAIGGFAGAYIGGAIGGGTASWLAETGVDSFFQNI